MKLLVVTSEYGEIGGGLSTACSIFIQMLEGLGIEYDLYVNEMNNGLGYSVVGGGYNPKLQKSLYTGGVIKTLKAQYQKKKIDFVVAFGAGENGLFASILAEQLGSKLIVMPRGSDINLAVYDERQYYTNKICLENATCVIALSKELIENAKRIVNRSNTKYFVIPNVSDIQLSAKNRTRSDSRQVVIGTGAYHLNEKKGIGNLLKVIHHLNAEYGEYDWKLELVGLIDQDLQQNYRHIIQALKIDQQISFLGKMTREAFKNQISNWDLYIQGSVFEGYSNSVVEAMSVGTPVILSDSGFFAENFKEKYPEMIFDSFEPKEIAEKIYHFHVLNDKSSLVQQYTESAKKLIEPSRVYEQWKNVFMELQGLDTLDGVMFHDINNSYTGVDYPVKGFKDLVELVRAKGFELCSARDYLSAVNKKNKIVCTFDDGYMGVYENALPILKEYGFTATVFVCPDLMGKQNDWNHKDSYIRRHMDDKELNELVHADWEIGSHGLSHINLRRYSETQLEEMLSKSKEMLETKFGEITSFGYPFGEYNDFIASRVKNVYNIAFSTSNGGKNLPADQFSIKRMTPEQLKKKLGAMQ